MPKSVFERWSMKSNKSVERARVALPKCEVVALLYRHEVVVP
jgi:hypothetical protein